MKYSNHPSRTFVLLKPDALERGLAGEILKRFERKGFKIVAAEMRWADKELAEQHYAEHKGQSAFFNKMVDSITCGPVIAVVLEGLSAVQASRQLIGFASPLHDSPIGTIRADFAIHEPQNLVHGSDSDPAAHREITLWFNANMIKPSAKPVEPELPKVPKKLPQLGQKKKLPQLKKNPFASLDKEPMFTFTTTPTIDIQKASNDLALLLEQVEDKMGVEA